MDKPLPVPDQATAFYWEHAARDELVIQGFEGSDHVQFPPNAVAEAFGVDGASKPVPVSGRGRVYAYTVLRQAFHPAFADDLPLVIALTELEDHPDVRILTNIVGIELEELRSGLPVEVVFESRSDIKLPQFTPIRKENKA